MSRSTRNLLLTALILAGLAFCKAARSEDAPQDLPREIEGYARRAMRYWHHPGGLPKELRFGAVKSIPQGFVGVCYPALRVLEVKEGYWNSLTDTGKLFLITHEIGHCVLGLPDDYNNPYSIMYFTQPGEDEIKASILIRMLFSYPGKLK